MHRLTPSSKHPCPLAYEEIKALAGLILEEPDHYTALGVDPGASFEEINESYRLAVMHFHPLNHRAVIGDDNVLHWLLSRAFTRLSEAYRVLSNSRRREVYDRSLKGERRDEARREKAKLSAVVASPDDETIHLQSFSYATPEWLSARLVQGEEAEGERRRVVRVNMCIPVVVTFENYWQETGETSDLSPLGASFLLSCEVEPGTLLRLQMRMPRQFRTRNYDDEGYTVNSQVLRVSEQENGWLVAVEFI